MALLTLVKRSVCSGIALVLSLKQEPREVREERRRDAEGGSYFSSKAREILRRGNYVSHDLLRFRIFPLFIIL